MPVRLLRRLTVTALRAAIRSLAAQATTPACRATSARPQRQKTRTTSHLSPHIILLVLQPSLYDVSSLTSTSFSHLRAARHLWPRLRKGRLPAPAPIQRRTFRPHAPFVILSHGVSASWRGGDRRPVGVAAPTPPGRSCRAVRGTAGGRCPMTRDREENRAGPPPAGCPSTLAAPGGDGGRRGQGAGKPLSPAASLLSMPVRLLRRLTVTALRAAIRSLAAQATTPACRATSARPQRQKTRTTSHLSPHIILLVLQPSLYDVSSLTSTSFSHLRAARHLWPRLRKGRLPAPAPIQRRTFRPHAPFVILSHGVSASWRGGDRRPVGVAAPTPPGRSCRAVRGTAGGRCPMTRDREENRAGPPPAGCPSTLAAPGGDGGCRGQGAGKPLSPAARRAGDHACMPGRSRHLPAQ